MGWLIYIVLCIVVPPALGSAIKKHRAVDGLDEDTRLQDEAQMSYLRGKTINVVDKPKFKSRAERMMGL